MSRPSNKTIRFYDEHAEAYARKSVSFDMEPLYRRFLELVPEHGRILDAGCGSGRDSRAFLDRGYDVVAIDGSAAMTMQAERLIGKAVQHCLFQEMTFENEFDGIWCCAALLHLPPEEISEALSRFIRALRKGGVCYVSFNEGTSQRKNEDRHFTDMTVSGFREMITETVHAEVIETWQSEDYRSSLNVTWVNGLFCKTDGSPR